MEAVPVRPPQLDGLNGLTIPGGDSTTMAKPATLYGLLPTLHDFARAGNPIWDACAGLVFLAGDLVGYDYQTRPGLLDIRVRRNTFGSQVHSFEILLSVPGLDPVAPPEQLGQPFPGVFVRASLIEAVGAGVKVLPRLEDGGIVAAQQGALLATAFHPQLPTGASIATSSP